MITRFLTLLLSFAVAAQAYAADFGLDVLALARHDAKVIAEELPARSYVGFLEGTFGDPLQNFRFLAESGKLAGFRVHLKNGTCYRNRVCESAEPKLNDQASLERLGAKWNLVAEQYPFLKCFISPVLEHDEKNRGIVEGWVSTLRRVAPKCEVVVSAFSGYVPANVVPEKHGNTVRSAIVSNDGASLFDSDSVKYRTNGSRLVLGWINRFNGRVTGEKSFVPPSRRQFWATRDDIRQAVRLLQPQSPTPAKRPAPCKSARTLKGRELWKTNAEDYGNGDARQNKPLLISLIKTSNLDILSPNGVKVGCLKYYGKFEDGQNRHYEGSCSGLTPTALMDRAGSEWLYVSDRGACIRVNAIRRKGYYR